MASTTYGPAPTGSAIAGLDLTITRPPRGQGSVTLGWILMLHGLNGTALDFTQGKSWGSLIAYLGDIGYGLIGATEPRWPGQPSRDMINNLWTYYQTLPDARPWWHVMAISDGGGQFLDWVAQPGNAAKCRRAWLNNPLTDPRWIYSLAGYVPGYDTGGVTPLASWHDDMDAAFAGNWAANSAGFRINDNIAAYRNLGVRMMFDQAADDTALPPQHAAWFVGQVNDPLLTVRAPARTGGHINANTLNKVELESFLRGWAA